MNRLEELLRGEKQTGDKVADLEKKNRAMELMRTVGEKMLEVAKMQQRIAAIKEEVCGLMLELDNMTWKTTEKKLSCRKE